MYIGRYALNKTRDKVQNPLFLRNARTENQCQQTKEKADSRLYPLTTNSSELVWEHCPLSAQTFFSILNSPEQPKAKPTIENQVVRTRQSIISYLSA